MRQSPTLAGSVVVLFLVGNLTTACAPRQYATPEEAIQNACSALGPKALSGALIGGLAGAAGGAAIGGLAGGGRGAGYGALAGLAAGLLVGAVSGNIADKRDCQEAQIALQQMNNAKVGQAVYWANTASGSHGSFTPVSTEYQANGQVCRQIRADYYMKDHQPVVGDTGVVCRTPTGDWARVGAPA